MKPAVVFFLFLVVFLTVETPAFGQSAAGRIVFPRIDPDPAALAFYRPGAGNQANTGNREYSWLDLAEVSLWASGASNNAALSNSDGTAALKQIRSIAGQINTSPQLPAAAREKAEFILGYMHKNLLTSYSVNQTRIDTMLQNGRYNCVSSAVLYMILCKSAGLDASAVVTRDHAFVTVHIDGEDIDVETTSPYGFDPGSRREFHDQFGRATGFAYVPARNYRDRQGISPVELVSLILWNRIADLEAASRFAESVPLAADRAALLLGPSMAAASMAAGGSYSPLFVDPRESLLERLFNYAALLLRSGREEECLLWAAYASSKYPEPAAEDRGRGSPPGENRWQEIVYAAVNNRLNKFIKAGQAAEARNFLDSQRAALNPGSYAQFDALLVESELANRANGIRSAADGDSVIAAVEDARRNGTIDSRKASELLIFSVQKTAAIISAAPGRDWLGAINYIKAAIARYGSSSDLEQSLAMYQSNRAADFHNRFAAAWNRKNYDEAKRILDEGLAEFPNDRRLLADRERVNKP